MVRKIDLSHLFCNYLIQNILKNFCKKFPIRGKIKFKKYFVKYFHNYFKNEHDVQDDVQDRSGFNFSEIKIDEWIQSSGTIILTSIEEMFRCRLSGN